MSDQDKPQGPTDQSGEGGLDAPAPPGGPQRTDSPAGPDSPGEPARDPGPDTRRVTRPAGGGDVPEPTQEGDTPSDEERDLQEENAGSSLDQPSS